jgi:hypothetical protein
LKYFYIKLSPVRKHCILTENWQKGWQTDSNMDGFAGFEFVMNFAG